MKTRKNIITTAGAITAIVLVIAAILVLGACSADPSPTDPGSQVTLFTDEPEGYAAKDGAFEAAMSGDEIFWVEPVEGFNTEEYAHVDERGFITVKARPLSTLSSDVDTASFANLRRMLREGMALSEVPTGAVRMEELLNYLDYNYPKPKDGDKFSITARVGVCPWNPDTKLLVLGFASAPEDTASSKGSNLVFLVDVSGSMESHDKLDLLKESFEVLVEQLGPEDSVSIVTYADGENLICEGVPGDHDREILRAIRRLEAGGSTNGERGLEMAYEVAERNYIEGGVNRIIMASDGDLNVGISSESELHDFVEKKREGGVYLSVLGFGTGNYKDNKMETLADHGNGSYHYIDCIEEAEHVLGDKVQANLVPFADDVKVQVEFNPAEVRGYRLLGYENREMADEDFRNDTKDAGDVGPGTQFTVAYEIVTADSAMELAEPELKYRDGDEGADVAEGEWLTAILRYRAFKDDKVHEQEITVGADDVQKDPDDDWKMAAAVLELGLVTRDSKWRGGATLEGAFDLLDEVDADKVDAYSYEALTELLELAQEADFDPEDPVGTPDDGAEGGLEDMIFYE